MMDDTQAISQDEQLAALRAALAQAQAKIEVLQERDEQHARSLAEAAQIVEQSQEHRDHATRHFDDIHEANDELQRLYEKVQAQQDQLVVATGELAAQSEELVGQKSELTVLYRELEAQQAELTVLYRELETQLAELHAHNDFLNAEVVKRTEAIAAQLGELKRINRILRDSDQYKDQFLSVISHELRTPLNFIMGFASVLEDELQGELNELQTRSVGKILEGTERMLGLVDNLLDSSIIQAGRFTIAPGMAFCDALMKEVNAMMQPVAQLKGVTLRTASRIDLPVPLDKQRIVQVLVNLIGNAIKFTPPGGVVTAEMAVDKNELLTTVTDTGIGIPDEAIPLLFDRFTQVDGTSTREAGGTGLGLAISQAIVEAHGGHIGVESQLGQGTTFHFRLPMN